MRYFYHYPETNGTEQDMLKAGPIHEVAAAAEKAGFHGFSVTDHPAPGARWLGAGGHQSLDPFVALGFAAATTSRIQLLTHLVVAPYRNPLVMAKAAATVDKLSGGRFVLGLGAGYQKSEFFALGVDFDERNVLFDEALDVMPLHWSGEPFSYQGTHFSARDVIARPKPVQAPIPIWIGGNSKLSRRRVAERAQGWMPMPGGPQLTTTTRTVQITSLEQLAGMIREVKDAAAENGRTDEIEILYSYSDPGLGQDPTVEADKHRQAIAEIADAGVNSLVISSPSVDAATTFAFLEAFGATYIA